MLTVAAQVALSLAHAPGAHMSTTPWWYFHILYLSPQLILTGLWVLFHSWRFRSWGCFLCCLEKKWRWWDNCKQVPWKCNKKFSQIYFLSCPESKTFVAQYCPTDYSPMVLVGLCIYLVSFQSGLGPVPWIMNAEVLNSFSYFRIFNQI